MWLQSICFVRQIREFRATSFTEPLASPSKLLGFCHIASGKLCAKEPLAPMGGDGKIIEVGEISLGRQGGAPKNIAKGYNFRNVVLTLVERGGSARSFYVDGTTSEP
jgi:hypothetical protein